jgi:hypothetical protein
MATVEAPSAPAAAATFVFPRVYPGCDIIVSNKVNMAHPIHGTVVEVGLSSVTAMCWLITRGTQPGAKIFYSCLHKDDPRLKVSSEQFLSDPDHGIFDLSDREKEYRMAIERLVQAEAVIAEQNRVLHELKRSLAQTDRQVAQMLSKSRKTED